MTTKGKSIIGLHLAVLLAGATGIMGRLISLEGLPLVWWRMLIAVGTLGLVMALCGRRLAMPFAPWLRIAGCGALLALHWVAFFSSIKLSNVSVGVVCIATSGFFTSLFDPLINRRRLSVRDVLISFIAIAGTLLIFSLDIRYRQGIAVGLLSAALYSLFSIFHVRTTTATHADSPTMLLGELTGGVLVLTILLGFSLHGSLPSWPPRSDVVPLLILGTLLTVVPIFLQIHALRSLTPFTVNISYNLEPVYSIVLAAIIFGETREVGLWFWLGVMLVIVSVALQTRRAWKMSNPS